MLDEWDAKNAIPQAVSVTLTLKDYGQIERIYLTTGGQLGDGNDS